MNISYERSSSSSISMLILLMAFDNPGSADLSNTTSTGDIMCWSPLSRGRGLSAGLLLMAMNVNVPAGENGDVMIPVCVVIQALIPCVLVSPFISL